MCKFSIFLHSIISLVSHFGQVPYLFTFHYIFQCPILGKFPIYLHSIRSLVSHLGQVLYLFTFHQIFSVPLCASSPSFYIPLYLQCPILGKFPIYLHSIRSSVSHSGQIPHNFVLHYIFSVPLCASSLSFYISLDLQCTIMCKFSIFFHFIISLVSHFGQVPYLFTFHQILVSHFGQVPYLFTFHYIFSVPLWASSLSFYISLYLQCPIMCKFPIFLRFIIYLVSHYVQVPYNFMFHYIFSVPFCASSLTSYVSLYLQCPILGKYPIILCFIIYLVSHYVQVPYLFTFHYIFSVPLCASSPFDTFHYIFSVPFWASTLQFYVSLYLQCPIMSKYPLILCFIIYLVSHYVQVLPFYIPLYLQCPILGKYQLYVSLFLQYPIMCKFPIFLRFIISSVSHYVPVLHIFTFHYIFSVPLCASSLTSYVSLYHQCPLQVYLFTFHYIFSFPFLCASSLLLIHFILLVSHSGNVPYSSTFHYICTVPLSASTH